MPDSFLTAQIKIIPKKGDTTQVKNWRPISLLSNFYKIISRLINNRLKKITNRVMSRGQKGFNQSRQIHEVIINALENMNFCKKNKIKGALLSIDMAKAFDSVDHSYLEKVYEFFEFGERIRRWLRAIGTGRSATIILENGKNSAKFSLKRGTAQGDSPSPFLYNLAAQILIWKIELDDDIKGLYRQHIDNAVPVPLSTNFFAYESNGETNKNESFADDANNFLLLDYDTLSKVKQVLQNFRVLSGLECNVEKSYIMRIGDLTGETEQRIIDLGFPFSNEITVLGFILQNSGNMIAKNYEKVRDNIFKIIRFWDRFNLTLPGKISIYKTLLLPQINYIATILTPTNEIIEELSTAMANFVTKGLNISKKRWYIEPEKGGLGLFELKPFIMGLQCTWVKRAEVRNDNWKKTLTGETGNVLDCHKLNPDDYGIAVGNIIESFRGFTTKFAETSNNFYLEKIFKNDKYGYGREMASKFDEIFFGDMLVNDYSPELLELTWQKLTVNHEFVRYDDFDLFSGFPLDNRRYSILRNTFNNLKRRFGGNDEVPVSIQTFFGKLKKGSKNFRKILTWNPPKKNYFQTNTQVKSFCKTAAVNFGTEETWARSLSSWNTFCYPNRLKIFLFKYYSNILGTGNRVIHFNRDIDPSCVFCTKSLSLPPPIETFSHVFYDCPQVNNIISQFFEKFFNENIDRNEYFNGNLGGTKRDRFAVNLVLDVLRYTIWQCKLMKNRISYHTIELETLDILETVGSCSNKIKFSINQCGFINTDGDRRQRLQHPP